MEISIIIKRVQLKGKGESKVSYQVRVTSQKMK